MGLDLDALTALLAAARPLPWRQDVVAIYSGSIFISSPEPGSAALIVAAVNALPDLIEAARREADAHRYVEMNRDVWDDNPNDPLGARQLSAAYRDIYQKVLNVLEGRQPLDNAGTAER